MFLYIITWQNALNMNHISLIICHSSINFSWENMRCLFKGVHPRVVPTCISIPHAKLTVHNYITNKNNFGKMKSFEGLMINRDVYSWKEMCKQ